MQRAKRPCGKPGCPHARPCPIHAGQQVREWQQEYDRQRGSAASRGYDRRWQKIRDMKLARSPLCEECLENGVVKAATDVDHKDGHVTNMSDENLRSLCHSCHSIKTAKENGSFGRKPAKS